MSNLKSSRANLEAQRSIALSALTGSYQVLGLPLAYASRIPIFQNNGNQDITVSIDGTTDQLTILAGDRHVYDLTTNNNSTYGLFLPKGTQIYVKGSSGTGTFYFNSFYAVDP